MNTQSVYVRLAREWICCLKTAYAVLKTVRAPKGDE